MYQEIDIKLNVVFLKTQYRKVVGQLKQEIIHHLTYENTFLHNKCPIKITGLEVSLNNMHVSIATSIDAKYDEPMISRLIKDKITKLLPFGVDIEVMELKEEAEIYGNK